MITKAFPSVRNIGEDAAPCELHDGDTPGVEVQDSNKEPQPHCVGEDVRKGLLVSSPDFIPQVVPAIMNRKPNDSLLLLLTHSLVLH